MAAPDSVKQLIDVFESNLDFYKSNKYNEAQLRQEFLDPLFRELGWDMDNTAGVAPQFRDVIHEASIKVGSSTKAPDYAFSIYGQYKFFLEAKKPSVNIRDNTEPAYQLRRYGWSAKLPISILTDFEEFAVYDCRKRPARGEKASNSRLNYFKFTDYLEKWDELFATFSKEAILEGSFDKYTTDSKRHRGTDTVDEAFLEEIENWRNLLARNFALRNPSLTVRDLNFAVQKTIDRLIFLRICEDRGTEDYKRLAMLLDGEQIYPRLLEQFMQADARYNSGLFHFTDESGRGTRDEITPNLKLDDSVLKDILSNLYYPESPYEFSVLPADILGQVYEQFLGKTIRLTDSHQAKIEEKPEVRKAGGVYYTPRYIVDYIVKNTLGRQLDGDDIGNPKPIATSKAAKIKVLDPACGSGSFLIVAYQYLLDWHLLQYTAESSTNEPDLGKIKRHSSGKNPKIYQEPGGTWKLTTDERKRILLNNIHGVDIDSQAVEVTKLSLLLKIIEGETHQVLQRDWIRERQRILPDLGLNIKCGNSLIDLDFYENEQMILLDEETQHRVNVFDWKTAFPDIMNRGGFDCVIGNPPYVRQESIKESKDYLFKHYEAASSTADLYVYFLEKAVRLLNEDGYAAFIVSSSFLKTTFAIPLRRTLKRRTAVLQVTDFGGLPVFASAKDTYVCIPVFQNIKQPEFITLRKINTLDTSIRDSQLEDEGYTIPHSRFTDNEWALRSNEDNSLYQRVISDNPPLGDAVSGLYYGIKTGFNTAFVLSNKVVKELELATDQHSLTFLHPVYGGRDIRRYHLRPLQNHLIVVPSGWTNKTYGQQTESILWQRFSSDNPNLAAHLSVYREKLLKRQDKGDYWWELRPCDYYSVLDSEKIIFPDICKNPRFILDAKSSYILNTAYAIDSADRYLLGILNSRFFWWTIGQISIPFGVRAGEFRYRLIYQYMKKFPVHKIDFDSASDVAKHDKMIMLVERMLDLSAKKENESNPDTVRLLATQLDTTDRLINQLVYDLYELTEEEVAIVEQSSKVLA